MSVNTAVPEPVLDDATRDFVRRTLNAGLVELDGIKKVVVSLMTESVHFTPERLAAGLVGADLLTPWQSKKLLAGKARGFHLGNYRLLRPLGKGGMGVVFLAQHAVMNRLMALKILPTEASKEVRRIERFKEEARASAKLDHPNIVQAYDFSEADGKLFIVMEYIEGIDLHRAIVRDGLMSPATSLDAIVQTTDALAHAHQRGIVHRDIKPSNILLRSDGTIKVSDMGLARIGWTMDAKDSPNRLTGTADFIAPEQAIDSQSVDARADIYSLGCTWYFLLTGKPPYSGSTVAQRLAKHQTAPVPTVASARSDCPTSISTLIQRMMAKRPADRPASAAELLDQLKRIGGGNNSRSELANRPLRSGSGSVAEDSSSYGPLDDSGPLSESIPVAEVEEFDFGNLPPVNVSAAPGAVAAPGLSAGPIAASPLAIPQSPASTRKTNAAKQDENQSVLLGVGLAMSVMALLVVLAITFYQMTKEEKSGVNLKQTESDKGKVFIIND